MSIGHHAAVLLPHHAKMLRDSAIDEALARKRGYMTVDRPSPGDNRSRELLKRCGFSSWLYSDDARYPGLLIPLFRVTGEHIGWQYRPDIPARDRKGKVRKYIQPTGRPSVLDLHPCNRSRILDVACPLWITEGVKKGDALASRGACVVTLSGVFNWRSRLGTLGDWEDVPLKGRDVIICFDTDASTNPNVARAMERLGRWVKSKGPGKVRYVTVPAAVNGTKVKGADDFLAAGGTVEDLLKAGKAGPPTVAGGGLDLAESEAMEQLVDEVLADNFCWAESLGWLRYRAGRWTRTPVQDVIEQARIWVAGKRANALRKAAEAEERGDQARGHTWLGVAKLWRGFQAQARIRSIVTLAMGNEAVMRETADFDRDPDLLNAPNGVIDLASGKLLPHDPSYMMTKMTAAPYLEGAAHPDWDQALQAIPPEVLAYEGLRYAQAITGYPAPDDVVYCHVGTSGENGKTTIFYGFKGALGDYFTAMKPIVLSEEFQKHHSAELMDLRGARMVLVEELPDDRHLSLHQIKELTQPDIKAHHMRQDYVTWANSATLFINSNPWPSIREVDHGSWRRLLRCNYPYIWWKPWEYQERQRAGQLDALDRCGDLGLRDRVKSGQGGIREAVLAWLVDHARWWYAGDPDAGRVPRSMGEPPLQVRQDTRDWEKRSNPMVEYCDEWLVRDPARHIRADEFAMLFESFLLGQGHMKWSRPVIYSRFQSYWEHHGARTVKKFTKRSDALSALSPSSTPEGYQALHGVRWKTDGDREDAEHQSAHDVSEFSGVAAVSNSGLTTKGFPLREAQAPELKPLKPGDSPLNGDSPHSVIWGEIAEAV